MWKLKTNVTPVILKPLGIIKKKHYNEQIPGFKREKVELKVNESQYKQSKCQKDKYWLNQLAKAFW